MTWRGRHIYLTGLPGAGKSSIGKELAALLPGYEFLDLDAEVERRAGKSIAALFASEGEAAFRTLERNTLAEIAEENFQQRPYIVATGGGTPLDAINRQLMRGSGIVVWVDVTVRQAIKNVTASILGGSQRPLLYSSSVEELTKKMRDLLTERTPFYEQSTLHFVARSQRDNDRTPAELAEELLKALEQMSRHIKLRPKFETLLVPSKLTEHTISIGSGIAASELVRSIADLGAARVVLVTDSTVAALHSKKLQQQISKERAPAFALHQVVIEPGETSKNSSTLFEIIDTFDEVNLSRKSDLIVSFGGGVVSDIAGFAASIYKRGIQIIHIPTTLIAQVDASIGGKTGIDHKQMKNTLGTFYQPKRVIIDPIYLQTLPKRELHSGIGELLKYALIGNPELWQRLSKMIRRLLRGLDPGYELLIREAAKEKLKYVSADEFERQSGVRELLNFGHTFGHAFESATGFSALLHGEAVILGMRAAAWLSMTEGLLSEDEWREIEVVLGRVPMPTVEFDPVEIVSLMSRDKKQQSGSLRLVLLERIGSAIMYSEAKPARIKEAIEFINSVS